MEWIEFTAKTVEEALDKALQEFETTSDKVEYEVLERESNGFAYFLPELKSYDL